MVQPMYLSAMMLSSGRREGIQRLLKTYKKTVNDIACVFIYGINIEVVRREINFREGSKVPFCTHLMQKLGKN